MHGSEDMDEMPDPIMELDRLEPRTSYAPSRRCYALPYNFTLPSTTTAT